MRTVPDSEKKMKKIPLLLLVLLPFCLSAVLYYLDKEYFLCPVEYRHDLVIRSDARGNGYFGTPRNGNRTHRGVDLFAEVGTEVVAARSGIVAQARKENGMGNYIVLMHPGGVTTLYGHLHKIYVRPGQFLRQGEIIGQVGKTGNANYRDIQPHLHFEVKKKGLPQDPMEYLR